MSKVWEWEREKKASREAVQAAADEKQRRLNARPIWLKIDEADSVADLKEIIRSLCDKVGLE